MKVQIALGLGSSNNLEVIRNAEHYVANITGNPLFTSPEIVAQVAKVETTKVNLHTEMSSPLSENKADKIKSAREALDRELTKLKSLIENVANDPSTPDSERLSIIHSAGMIEKAQAHHGVHVFTAVNGEISGTVLLTAKGGANAHEWQYTNDTVNYTGKIAAKSTTTSYTEIFGLTKTVTYAFFHKAIDSGGKTDWEGPIFVTIQ